MNKQQLQDKYFCALDAYNKELIPHKSAFFKNVRGIFDFRTFLKELSFNTTFNSLNYRYGKRYFHFDDNKFCWTTSNSDKKIPSMYYDKDERMLKQWYKDAKFTDEDIDTHFLSCYKQNRLHYKYGKIKELRDNYKTSLQNIYKCDGKIFGSSQIKETNILLIDIDDYEDKPAIKTLQRFIKEINISVKEFIFLEQNAFTGGIHCALVLPQNITDEKFYTSLQDKLKEKDIKIECNFINTILRFPLSFEYVAIIKDDAIFNTDRFIDNQYWEKTFEEFYGNINHEVTSSQYIFDLIHNCQPSKDNKFINHWKQRRNLFVRTVDSKEKEIIYQNFYSIYRGNRFEAMKKMIPYAKMQGMTLDEVVDMIYEQDISSKDLTKWNKNKLKKNISSFYNRCNLTPCSIISKTSSLVSNLENLPEITKDFLSSETLGNFISSLVIENINSKRGYVMSNDKRDVLIKQIPYIVKEVIGKMFYDIKTEKRFINKNLEYYNGFQLSDEFLKAVQEQSIIDLNLDTELGKTSIQYLKTALIKALKLKEIKKQSHKRNWINGSCKPYMIRTTYELYELLRQLYNRCNSKELVKEFVKSEKEVINLIILNILLDRNIGLEDTFMIEHLKMNLIEDIPKQL